MLAAKDRFPPFSITFAPGTGSLDMQNFSLSENGEVSLDFTAELIRMVADEYWELSPEEGMAPVSMSGHVSLTIPPEYRVGD